MSDSMRQVLPWCRFHWRELTLALFILSPWLSLLVFGVLWLHDNNAFLPWLVGVAALGMLAWPLRRAVRNRLRKRAQDQIRMVRQPSPEWNAHALDAWGGVEEFAEKSSPLTFTEVEPMRKLVVDTVRIVAQHFNPKASRPEGNITLPEILLLAERTARDLRTAMMATVPGIRLFKVSHAFSLGNVVDRYGGWAEEAYKLINHAYDLYLIYTNPPSGFARIAKGQGIGASFDVGLQWFRAYGTRKLVLESGRAAIDLYSGKLRLSDEELACALEAERETQDRIANRLPQLLIAGQVNTGKSSLVNALAGEVLCEINSIPVPAVGVKHRLTVDGKDVAFIVEAVGLTASAATQDATIKAVQESDIVVWVASATQPGRAADAETLAALARIHAADINGKPPPILVALTHVDQLSPATEWSPPYNVVEPTRRKERLMKEAIVAVSKSLGISVEVVVPVAVPRGNDPWNTEFLWGCIAARLDEAKYRQLARLRQARAGWSWSEAVWQAMNVGRRGIGAAADIAADYIKRGTSR